MKKLMTIALAAALMFAVAGQVQAATPLETTGEFRVRMFYLDSYKGAVAADDTINEFWDQRLRLGMKWQITDSVKLNARADVLEGAWGDNGSWNAYTATTTLTPTTTTNDAGEKTTTYAATTAVADGSAKWNKRPAIDFDYLNMEFVWPGAPLTFTIGRQEANWGLGVVSSKDARDRFKVLGAFDFGTLGFVYQKRMEIFTAHDTIADLDDNREYALLYIGKAADWNFGILELLTFLDATAGAQTSQYTTSVFAKGKAGPVNLGVEVVLPFGQTKYSDTSKAENKRSGLLAYLGASMPAGPVSIGIEGAYAQGDDYTTTDKSEGVLKFDYHAPFASVVLFNNMDLNGFAGESDVAGNSSLGNAVAGKLTVTAKPAAGFSLTGAVVYAQRLKDVSATVEAKPLGTEIDLIASYAITPNVSWTVGAGYLLVGDFYKQNGVEAKNALAATSQFVLMF